MKYNRRQNNAISLMLTTMGLGSIALNPSSLWGVAILIGGVGVWMWPQVVSDLTGREVTCEDESE